MRSLWHPRGVVVAAGLLGCLAEPREPVRPDPSFELPPVSFRRDIQPILAENCITCHGPAADTRRAELRLDVRDGLFSDPRGRPIVVPGEPGRSLLYLRVSAPEGSRMPPKSQGNGLSEGEIELIGAWIEQGAAWDEHWSLTPPARPRIPEVRAATQVQNPIDAFVLAKLEAEGRSFSPPADSTRLLRRLSLDLIGLPPRVAELDAFAIGDLDANYSAAVERLFVDPRYGEHMARDWLDAARYADSNGYHGDQERQMWPWRDWVIAAFNQNMAFDRFTIEQLAGDLLPGATPDQVLATGFNRNHAITTEGGTIDEEFRLIYAADRVDTIGKVWLGLTIGCARCHDHKYDPITQRDYYRLLDCFNRVGDLGDGGPEFAPTITARGPLVEARRATDAAALAALEQGLAGHTSDADFEAWRAQLAQRPPSPFDALPVRSAESTHGAVLTVRPDDSVLVGGPSSPYETLLLTLGPAAAPIQALRLEALSDDALPAGGPGRGGGGLYSIGELSLFRLGEAGREPVVFALAVSSDGGDAWLAFDGLGSTAWAPTAAGPSSLLLVPEVAIPSGSSLELRIEHFAARDRVLGALRVLGASDEAAVVPSDLAARLTEGEAELTPEEEDRLREIYDLVRAPEPTRSAHRARQRLLRRQRASDAEARVMIMRDGEPGRQTNVLERGDYQSPGDVVSCGVPWALGQLNGDAATRLEVAEWLVSPKNPLVARVIVNRLWRSFMGRGLVETVDDFGLRGEIPVHLELLDWLAVELVESGWDLRHVIRLIVGSNTYRQDSRVSADQRDIDPDNRSFGRGPRGPLPAEVLRDQALFVSGLLESELGGPPVRPYHPHRLWEALNDSNGEVTWYRPDRGPQLYRRSIYTYWKRSLPPPALASLGAPARDISTVRRDVAMTPMQALVLANEPGFVEAARRLGARMIEEGGASPETWIEYGFRTVTSVRPTPEEAAILLALYVEERAMFEMDPNTARAQLAIGDAPQVWGARLAEHAALTRVARVILNLSAATYKE